MFLKIDKFFCGFSLKGTLGLILQKQRMKLLEVNIGVEGTL